MWSERLGLLIKRLCHSRLLCVGSLILLSATELSFRLCFALFSTLPLRTYLWFQEQRWHDTVQLLPTKHSSNHSITTVFDDECTWWRSGCLSLPGTLIRNMTKPNLCDVSFKELSSVSDKRNTKIPVNSYLWYCRNLWRQPWRGTRIKSCINISWKCSKRENLYDILLTSLEISIINH